jgi:hypothetical protein
MPDSDTATADRPDAAPVGDAPRLTVDGVMDRWHGIALRATTLLRDPAAAQFMAGVQRADDEIASLARDEPDASLLLLIHTAGAEMQRYSVRHALLVTLVCDLAARSLPGCTDEHRCCLRRAALTMNISMTRLQDQLALQSTAVSADQRALIDGHAARSGELLREMGVADDLWLQAVEHHHDAPPGPLAEQTTGLQLARLIRRADLFAARMSPRKVRAALSATLAAKGAYYDERVQPDEAGALVIKALGVYPAGSYVKLASGDLAVVLRRGPTSNQPVVASVTNADGIPHLQPLLRNTDRAVNAIVCGVAPKDVRVRTSIERLLKLAR